MTEVAMDTTQKTLLDVVCGRGASDSVHRMRVKKCLYYFCSASCWKLFQSNPALYVKPSPVSLNPTVTYREFQQRVDPMFAKPWNDDDLRKAARGILKERALSGAEAPSDDHHPEGGVDENAPIGAE